MSFAFAQLDYDKDNRVYAYSAEQIDYYFFWKSDEKQTFYWDTIYGGERCTVFIINNSSDTLLINRVYNTSSYPVFWEVYDRSRLYLPGDTIKVNSKIHRRHGPFNRPLQIGYRSSSNLNSQIWHLSSKGCFMDNLELKRMKEAKRLKELEELRKANPSIQYYDSGKIKSKRISTPENDSLPIFIEYYENGLIKIEEFRESKTRKKMYDQLGRLQVTWNDEGLRTEYHTNGKIKFKQGKDRDSTTDPFQTHYFENGCIQKEVFANETIFKEYDSLKCGKLVHHKVIDKTERTIKNGKVITHYQDGKMIGQTFQKYGKTKNEVRGEYSAGKLTNGVVSYYSQSGELLFENKIVNGERDSILNQGEVQGNQINLVDTGNNKTGLWITTRMDKKPLILSTDYSQTFNNTKNFDLFQYEYESGDTIARITFNETGGISSYLYIRDKEKRINANKEYALSYHPNGFLKTKSYKLKNGKDVLVRYSDVKANEIVSGEKGHIGKMIFKNNKLIEIRSEKEMLEKLDSYAGGTAKETHLDDYCIEKGNFRNFELYNGFIYYHRKDGSRILTEKVVNGIIQGNPRVTFTEPKLTSAVLLANDLNFNGWTEQREVDKISVVNLWLKPEEIEQFNWSELKKFKKLSFVYVNERGYRLDDYVNYDSLKVAILANKGAKLTRRNPWEWEPEPPRIPNPPDLLNRKNEIVDFADFEAKFPGGTDSLTLWISKNLRYPTDIDVEGKVYVSFVVHSDGTITSIKILKGIGAEYDKEAIRLISTMPKWIPAQLGGREVNSIVRLPIVFHL